MRDTDRWAKFESASFHEERRIALFVAQQYVTMACGIETDTTLWPGLQDLLIASVLSAAHENAKVSR
jgi:hypothetical protein